MNTHQDRNDLPLKRSLSLAYILSILIAALLLAASLAGLLSRTATYPTEELARSFVPNDVVNLFLGLPILLGSLWLARGGKLAGLLCWPGALFFVTYTYLAYVFAMPFHWAFVLHLALAALSVYALIALVASIDGDLVRQELSGAVPEKFAGGILVGLGSLFFLRAIGVLASALVNETPLARPELAVNIADFLTTPAWVIGGILLWRRQTFGYVISLGLLFQGSMLFIALIAFLLLQPFLTSAPFALTDVLVVFVMGSVCFVPLALFVRGITANPGRSLKRKPQ